MDRISTLARLLRAECAAQEMSGAELARRAGMSQTGAAKLLRGETDVTLGVLLGVLGALGRDLKWLHAQGVTPPAAKNEKSEI